MSLDDFAKLAATPVGLMILGLFAFYKGWIVRGALYDEVRAERDKWEDRYMRATGIVDRTVNMADKTTSITDDRLTLIQGQLDVLLHDRRSRGREGRGTRGEKP